jgi:prefoldin subunit 5
MSEKKPLQSVQKSLVCTMQIAEELGNIQDQLSIIEKAKSEIRQSESTIEELNNIINVELNKYLYPERHPIKRRQNDKN